MTACTCYPVPEEYWTTHYGSVDPATQWEPNPDCPEHFPKTSLGHLVEAMVAMGHSATQAQAALAHFADLAGSPKRELQWRLNERLQGRDPGKPNHWQGLP